jgi:hypothetical protein
MEQEGSLLVQSPGHRVIPLLFARPSRTHQCKDGRRPLASAASASGHLLAAGYAGADTPGPSGSLPERDRGQAKIRSLAERRKLRASRQQEAQTRDISLPAVSVCGLLVVDQEPIGEAGCRTTG